MDGRDGWILFLFSFSLLLEQNRKKREDMRSLYLLMDGCVDGEESRACCLLVMLLDRIG